MNNSFSTKWKKISMILTAMCGLATLSFNCSPTLFESRKGGGNGSFDLFSVFEETNAPIVLMTAEQTYQSMLNVTGQSTTPVARPEYLSRFGTLASTPSLSNMNSPLMLASTSLAGDVCSNAINKETAAGAARTLFVGVDFNAAPNASTFAGAVAAMATAFYGRQINGEEAAILTSYFTEMTAVGTKNGALTRAVVLGACSSMLSSFDSLVY